MIWLTAVLIAAVSNLDNLAVGFALGMRDRTVALAPNVVIAAVTMAGTAVAMTSGRVVARTMSPSVASAVGSLIIIAIGVWTIIASRHGGRPLAGAGVPDTRRSARRDPNGLSWRETLALGVALSLNNVASGVGAGIAGVSPVATTLFAGAFSLICIGGGSRFGWSAGRLVAGRKAPLIAGLMLIGVGAATMSGVG